MDHYIGGKIVDQLSDVLWSKLSSKHSIVLDYDRFLDIVVKFKERCDFLMFSAAQVESTFTLNVL
jgi:hypothetical protein